SPSAVLAWSHQESTYVPASRRTACETSPDGQFDGALPLGGGAPASPRAGRLMSTSHVTPSLPSDVASPARASRWTPFGPVVGARRPKPLIVVRHLASLTEHGCSCQPGVHSGSTFDDMTTSSCPEYRSRFGD